MKTLKRALVSLFVSALLLAGTAYAASYLCEGATFPVVVNGSPMTFTDVQPMVYNGRTLLPLRAVAEALNIPIQWDEQNRRVVIDTVDIERLKDSCVMIRAGDEKFLTWESSGVIIDYDEVLTCYHCIDDGQTKFFAYYDDSEQPVELFVTDTAPEEDAAILKPAEMDVKPVKIGDSDEIKVGDTVFVVSCPKENKNVVSSGIVKEMYWKTISNGVKVFLTNATANAGSSGGACFNNKGELIGIVTSRTNDGLTCIIPINEVRKALAA